MSRCPGSSSAHDTDAQKLDLEDRDCDQGSLASKGQPLHGARSRMLPCLGNLGGFQVSNENI